MSDAITPEFLRATAGRTMEIARRKVLVLVAVVPVMAAIAVSLAVMLPGTARTSPYSVRKTLLVVSRSCFADLATRGRKEAMPAPFRVTTEAHLPDNYDLAPAPVS